jgi:hypothetical protein
MNRLRVRESAIQRAVLDHWRKLGEPDTLVAAVPNAGALGQPGLHPGIFDLICIGALIPTRIGFIELKADKGVVSDAQEAFKRLLLRHDISYAITYGRDMPIDVLEMWGLVRRRAKPLIDTTKRRHTRMLP